MNGTQYADRRMDAVRLVLDARPMGQGGDDEPIRTPRLVLVPLTAHFVAALVDGDAATAGRAIGASVSRWFVSEPAHFVQLSLAQAKGESLRPAGLGRAIILIDETNRRRLIGSIGFHGPADERDRLEVGCVIHPAYRGRGHAGEAMTAMFDWAAAHLGVTRFLVSVPTLEVAAPNAVEVVHRLRGSRTQLEGLAAVIEARTRAES